MNEQTFEQLIDRMHRYVDTLSTESIDMEQVLLQLIQATNIVFASVAPIDLPPLHETQQQTLGHRLVNFRGDLKVPEIEKDHVIPIDHVTEQDEDFSLDLSWLFGLPLGWAGIKALTTRVRNSRRTRPKNRRPTTSRRLEPKNRRPTLKKTRKRTGRTQSRLKPSNQNPSQTRRASIPDKLKSRLVKKYPGRFNFDKAGNLRETKPGGKTKPVSNIELEKYVDELIVQDVKFPKALKALRRLAVIAGTVFTVYDLYKIYDIATDDTLSKDEKILGIAPIVGELVGATSGAIAGGTLGTIATGGPWGTFLGAVVGGITGAFAGDAVGEMIAEYVVEDMEEPPLVPYDKKTWDQLTPDELQHWMMDRSNQSRRTNIDTPGTQEMQFKPPVLEQSKLQFNLKPLPEQPQIYNESEKKIIPIDRSNQPPLTPQEEDILLEQNPQIQQIDNKISTMIERFIIDKNRLDDQHKQIVRDIEQLV